MTAEADDLENSSTEKEGKTWSTWLLMDAAVQNVTALGSYEHFGAL